MDEAGVRAAPFPTEVVAAIKAHMNGDHGADSLLICRMLGHHPTASRAWVESVDEGGIDFGVDVEGREGAVRLEWPQPILERAQVRAELVQMVDHAHQVQAMLEGRATGVDPQ